MRILLIDDDPDCGELLNLMLAREGIACDMLRVETELDMCEALEPFLPRAIICDFSMPKFDGYAALTIANCLCPQVPFFFFSGTISPQAASVAMEHGAKGYAEKGDFAGLVRQLRRHLPLD